MLWYFHGVKYPVRITICKYYSGNKQNTEREKGKHFKKSDAHFLSTSKYYGGKKKNKTKKQHITNKLYLNLLTAYFALITKMHKKNSNLFYL